MAAGRIDQNIIRSPRAPNGVLDTLKFVFCGFVSGLASFVKIDGVVNVFCKCCSLFSLFFFNCHIALQVMQINMMMMVIILF